MVFVLDTNRKILAPCHEARARILLTKGKAAVFRMEPFTIILKREVKNPIINDMVIKVDPGSKYTGLALISASGKVCWGCNIRHRGQMIKKKLESRRALRRGRRNRIRYRKPRFRTKGQIRNAEAHFSNRVGKVPPSVESRIRNTMTWIKRLLNLAPVGTMAVEHVKFDMQKMENQHISGIEYQQGTLQGYNVKEYILEKFQRTCVYCGKKNIPLEVEHVVPKSKGGSNRISNLTLACVGCNQKKGNKPIEDFLKKKPALLKKVLAGLKRPLIDAAAVNSARLFLLNEMREIGLFIETGTGVQTKLNRKKFGIDKDHWKDAACVGNVDKLFIPPSLNVKTYKATGQGGRQKAMCDKYGYPKAHRPLKPLFGWRSGDIGKCLGKIGRVTTRSSGSFLIIPFDGSTGFSRNVKLFTRTSMADGYVAIIA